MSFIDSLASDASIALIGDIAGPYVLLSLAGRSIGSIIPNVTVREVISDENVVTQHPVSIGTPVADHIFANPVVVEMLVGFSDSTGAYPGYSIDVYNAFLALRDSRQVFDVSTGKRMFQNMVFTSIVNTTDDTLRIVASVVAFNFAPYFDVERPDFRPARRGAPGFDPVTLPSDMDWFYRPMMRGLCRYEALVDGTLHLEDVAEMNAALDVAEENQHRAVKAAEKDRN